MSQPIPLPGEMIGSYIARLALRQGAIPSRTMATRLGLDYKKGTMTPFGLEIANLHRGMPQLHRWVSASDWVWKHTIAPLFVAFSPRYQTVANRERWTEGVIAHGGWRMRTAGRSHIKSQGLRYCRACLRDDESNFGVAYWHREHQIRAVTVCWKHGDRLKEHRWLPGVGLALDLPGRGRYSSPGDELQIPEAIDKQVELRVATRIAHLLQMSPDSSPIPYRDALSQSVAARDLKAATLLRPHALLDLMVSTYGRDFLGALGYVTTRVNHASQRFSKLITRNDGLPNPVTVVLLAEALGVGYDWTPAPAPQRTTSMLPKSSRTAMPDSTLEQVLKSVGYVLHQAAKKLGIDQNRLIDRIIRAGLTCPILTGPKTKFRPDEIRRMMDAVRNGASGRDLMKEFGRNHKYARTLAIYDPKLRSDAKSSRFMTPAATPNCSTRGRVKVLHR